MNHFRKLSIAATSLALTIAAISLQVQAYDGNDFEHTYHQIGHTDGWDENKNWIGVNIYEIIIKDGEKMAVGHFGVQGTPAVIQFNENIVWKHNTDGFLSDAKALTDFSHLEQTERNQALISEARRLSY